MKRIAGIVSCLSGLVWMSASLAQVAPVAAPDQLALLKSSNPTLAANKKLVFDMYRSILIGGHTEMVEQFFTRGYIQHNPNVATGRDALVAYLKQTRPVRPIPALITFPVISIMAEGDLVNIATVSFADDTENPGKKFTSTHFDQFRIENGRIAEHWDHIAKSQAALHTDPNVTNKP